MSDGLRPLWPVVTGAYDEEGVERETLLINWLDEQLEILQDEAEYRVSGMIRNIRFKNAADILAGNRGVRATDVDGRRLKRSAMFVINHARDLVNQSVARALRYKPNVNVFPVNNEYGDRLGAKFSKRVVDHIFRLNESRDCFRDLVTDAKICGEAFIFPEYNPHIGDIDPEYQKIRELKELMVAEGEQVDFLQEDEAGDSLFRTKDNRVINLSAVKRVGEVEWKTPPSWMVLHPPAYKWKDVPVLFWGELVHRDNLQADYPDVDLSEFGPVDKTKGKDGRYGQAFKYGDWATKWTMIHQPQPPYLDEGYFAHFIEGHLLKHGPMPYSYRKKMAVRLTDYDDQLDAHGISFLEDLRPPLVLFNNMMNAMYRNVAIASAPKLLLPNGTTNPYAMANGPFVVPYQYPMKPELLSFRAFGNEIFTLAQDIKTQAQQISGTFGPSRGEPLKNARAASILNFYEEQEAEREGEFLAKLNAAVVKAAEISVGIAGDFYKEEDGRTVTSRWKEQQI